MSSRLRPLLSSLQRHHAAASCRSSTTSRAMQPVAAAALSSHDGGTHPTLLAPATCITHQHSSLMRLPTPSVASIRQMTQVGHGSGGRVEAAELRDPPALPFSILGLNHIAVAVPDLTAASEHFRLVFGAQVTRPVDLPEHGVTVVVVHISNATIELLHPLGDSSPIAGFLREHPRGGLHHLCFTVNDIEAASRHVAAEGVAVLGDGKPKIGAHNNPVVFLNPKHNVGILCEFEQVHCIEKEDRIA